MLFSCASSDKQGNETTSKKYKIVCTTGMLGDAVENLVGSKAEVITLMGSGVDPHLYKATQGDLKHLLSADVIVYNGLHLEGKMGDVFSKMTKRKKMIVASNALQESWLINNTDFQGAQDPHIWFDVSLWIKAIDFIGKELMAANDTLAPTIVSNWTNYEQQLQELDTYVKKEIESIDSAKRVLITAHDAFGYFGRAYHIEVKGLQGISTVSEYGLKDVSNLVDFISKRGIKAVFVESSVSDRSLKAVIEGCQSKGHSVEIGGTLFSDAMGAKGTEEGTYVGMVKHNVKTMVNGLN